MFLYLPEQPMCRHGGNVAGVSTLVERASCPRQTSTLLPTSRTGCRNGRASSDVKLGELTHHGVMQQVVQAFKVANRFLGTAQYPARARFNLDAHHQQLDERRRESEVTQIQLDSDVRSRKRRWLASPQDLEVSVKEAKSLQAICHDLQREVEQQKAVLPTRPLISHGIEQFEGEVKAIATS